MSGLWSWHPDAGELVRNLPHTLCPAAWAAEQSDRWEAFEGDHPVEVVNRPTLAAGSLQYVSSTLEALLVRDALRSLGHEAVRLWDTARLPNGGDVVITSLRYGGQA